MMEKVYYADIEIPLGTVWAAATDRGLVQVHASGRKEAFLSELRRRTGAEPVYDGARASPSTSIYRWT